MRECGEKKEADQTKRVVPWYIHAFILYRFLFSSSSSFLTFLLSLSVIKIIIIKEKVCQALHHPTKPPKKQTGLCWRMIGWSPGSRPYWLHQGSMYQTRILFSLSSQRRFYIFVFSTRYQNSQWCETTVFSFLHTFPDYYNMIICTTIDR